MENTVREPSAAAKHLALDAANSASGREVILNAVSRTLLIFVSGTRTCRAAFRGRGRKRARSANTNKFSRRRASIRQASDGRGCARPVLVHSDRAVLADSVSAQQQRVGSSQQTRACMPMLSE